MQGVKLLTERNINIEKLSYRVANLFELMTTGNKWEGDKDLVEDILYILKPHKLTRASTKLRYGNYILDLRIFDYSHDSVMFHLSSLIDKRNDDMVLAFREVINFDISIIIEVLRTALLTKQSQMIPTKVLIILAACELEIPQIKGYLLAKRPSLNHFNLRSVQEQRQSIEDEAYKELPVEQRGLFTFSSTRHQEGKKEEYEKRKARLADREAHRLPENTDKEQAG
jgi:hypothetical protein